MAVVPQRPLRGPQRQPDPETPAEDDDAEDDGGDGGEEVCAGYVTVSIVGLQYYAGTVNRDEMVQLIREQQNPYDANAIRVDNVGGERVGHIERYKAWPGLCWPVAAESPAIALHLAPLIDRGEVKIEGLVTSGVTNKYKMPCQVYVHCKAAAADEVVDKLTSAGLPFICEAKGQAYDTTGSQSFQSGNVEKNFESIFKSLAVARGQRQQIEPPSTISSPLFPHQKEALSWLVDREKDRRLPPFWERQECKGETRYLNTITNYSSEDAPQPFRGGILADDMGLGKTLTMLALIATHRPSALLSSVPKKLHDVVSCSTAGSRPNKRQKSDAVVTSTSQVNATDLESMECSTSARATLIVCPLSVVANWAQQIQQHTVESSLSVYEYLGPKRIRDPEELGNYDVVLTTYSTLAVEGDESSTSATLQKVCWFRVILDEAHCIKSPKALQSKAARSLTALHRWAVTGTPIQNKLADLYSLMSFLHLQPLDEQSFWLRTIERPLTYGDPKGYDRLRVLMASIALRRTKSEQVGQPSIELPPRTVQLHLLDLWSCDRQKYEQWEENGRDLIKDMIKHGTVLKNYANVLEVILRLRQICDHASLCPSLDCLAKRVAEQEAAPPELMQKLLEYVRDSGDDDCPICLCPAQPPVITRCAHIYCWRCINKVVTRGNGQCPLCRTAVSSADLIRVPPETRIDGNEATSSELPSEATSSQSQEAMPGSAKIAALAQSLEDVRGADPSIKSVVFSQFTGMLRLVRQVLKASGVRCLTLDGTLSRKQREEVLRVFQSETACSPSVLLVSMKAAGVGINLTAASRVYLLDPWWNPAVEEQAMDRVHRLGQTRPVTVVRFIVRDSIEERILELQERKRHLAAAAFESRTPEDLQRARVDDICRFIGSGSASALSVSTCLMRHMDFFTCAARRDVAHQKRALELDGLKHNLRALTYVQLASPVSCGGVDDRQQERQPRTATLDEVCAGSCKLCGFLGVPATAVTAALAAAAAAAAALLAAGRAGAILEADDDEDLLERIKGERRGKIAKRQTLGEYKSEAASVQKAVYKLSRTGQALDEADYGTASRVLGASLDADWVAELRAALAKVTSNDEEQKQAEEISSALGALQTAVLKDDVEGACSAFLASAGALEKWSSLTGLNLELQGL
eukprot:SM000001S04804  [mRNA]  locus=s1:2261449:2268312:- [translate_table: standard]